MQLFLWGDRFNFRYQSAAVDRGLLEFKFCLLSDLEPLPLEAGTVRMEAGEFLLRWPLEPAYKTQNDFLKLNDFGRSRRNSHAWLYFLKRKVRLRQSSL